MSKGISKEDIKKLADLARIDVTDEEAQSLGGDIDAILGYVGQVSEVAGKVEEGIDVGTVINVLREDENPTPPETYSKELLAEFPNRDKNYLKVKKIL
jgi:aspartyl-tRNA(Asn)/glutamyl-tRNA(Gln) amidotransferase subunit C